MPTIVNLVADHSNVVLLHWHPPCAFVSGETYGANHLEALFRRLTRQLPDQALRPTRKGLRRCRDQAKALIGLNTIPERIVTSNHALAEHGARELSLALLRAPGGKIRNPVADMCLDAPRYLVEGLRPVLDIRGQFVISWLNGRYDKDVALEDPGEWAEGFVDFVEEKLERGGLTLCLTHYEQLVAGHAFWVSNQEPPTIADRWVPSYGGGLAVYDDDEQFRAAEYDVNFSLV